jgi:hypothetical protein
LACTISFISTVEGGGGGGEEGTIICFSFLQEINITAVIKRNKDL